MEPESVLSINFNMSVSQDEILVDIETDNYTTLLSFSINCIVFNSSSQNYFIQIGTAK